jgi:hypothetical protein
MVLRSNLLLQSSKCILIILTKILFDNFPEKFDEVQFTVEFQQEETQMASSLNHLLDNWLELKDVLCTASCFPLLAFILALHEKFAAPQTMFKNV